jgi:thiol:disulfide interchange protein
MGIVAALLAGACVAPVVITVVLLAAKLYSEGHSWGLFLPFALGLSMALPWPLLPTTTRWVCRW